MIHTKIDISPCYPSACLASTPKGQKDVQKSFVLTYILDDLGFKGKKPLVLICPGGGYGHISKREGEPVALAMNALNLHSAVLSYSIAPRSFPSSLLDLCFAISFLRENSKKWGIDENKIIVAGFSAGAHLALSLACYFKTDMMKKLCGIETKLLIPNALLLSYPVVTGKKEIRHEGSFSNWMGKGKEQESLFSIENHITKDFPSCFIWHTNTDEAVSCLNSLLLVSALKQNGIPFEYHLFAKGRHGLSLSTQNSSSPDGKYIDESCSSWLSLFDVWQKGIFSK